MSAYVVDKAHIDALVRAATEPGTDLYYWRADPARPTGGDGISVTRDDRDRYGQLLTDANVESVSYRYPSDDVTNLPGRTDAWWLIPYRYAPNYSAMTLEPVQALKAIDGYEYQACEHPGWEGSEAQTLLGALRQALIRKLPGYEDALWTIEEEDAAAAPQIVSLFEMAAANRDAAERLESWATWRDAWLPGGE